MSPTLLELLVITLLIVLIVAYAWTLRWSLRKRRMEASVDAPEGLLPPAGVRPADPDLPARSQGENERVD